jgi:thiamine-phosphate pyrophosphorylase
MADFAANVRSLSAAAWRVRQRSRRAAGLPFALAFLTDDRRQTDIVSVLERLPSGRKIGPICVIFRHDRLPLTERFQLATECCDIARRNGHFFLMARAPLAIADGTHNLANMEAHFFSRSVHNLREGLAARNTDLALVSPVFATRSHPDARPLGIARAAAIAQRIRPAAFALGGITTHTSRRLEGTAFSGIAAIGAFGGD